MWSKKHLGWKLFDDLAQTQDVDILCVYSPHGQEDDPALKSAHHRPIPLKVNNLFSSDGPCGITARN